MSERFKDVSLEELEKMINERQQFLGKVMVFVADITQLIGETTELHETDSYTTFTKEVIGLGHFSFRYHSTLGLNEYMVWYHPMKDKIENLEVAPVLDFEELDEKENWIVKTFKEGNDWQTELLTVIEHKDELLAQRKKAEEERKEQLRLQTEAERKRAELLKVAERLRL